MVWHHDSTSLEHPGSCTTNSGSWRHFFSLKKWHFLGFNLLLQAQRAHGHHFTLMPRCQVGLDGSRLPLPTFSGSAGSVQHLLGMMMTVTPQLPQYFPTCDWDTARQSSLPANHCPGTRHWLPVLPVHQSTGCHHWPTSSCKKVYLYTCYRSNELLDRIVPTDWEHSPLHKPLAAGYPLLR